MLLCLCLWNIYSSLLASCNNYAATADHIHTFRTSVVSFSIANGSDTYKGSDIMAIQLSLLLFEFDIINMLLYAGVSFFSHLDKLI